MDINAGEPGKISGQPEIEERIEAARQKIDTKYLSKLKGFDNYDVDIWEGTPYVEILKFAREKQADLIVMAHHTREIDPELALLGPPWSKWCCGPHARWPVSTIRTRFRMKR